MMQSRSRLLLLALVTLAILSCGRGNAPEKPKGRPPAPVSVVTAVTGTVPVYVEAIGTVESLSQVSIKSMINGEITKVHFREGQDVSKGEILFTLDSRPNVTAINKAEADLVRIRTQLATAKTNAERYGKLVKDGIVTSEQYESFRTQADSFEADLGAQKANIESLRVLLSYCTIRSPISGRTGNLLIHAGNIVKANDSVSLVTINQITPIAVGFSVPELELNRARAVLANGGLWAEAIPSGGTGDPEKGKVTFIDNAVDSATGTIKLKATFRNRGTKLWPGQFASVRLLFPPLKNVVTVPTQSVLTGQKGEYVYVVKDDLTVEMRVVRSGIKSGGFTVILDGVKPGEQIVSDGQLRLGPGSKVEVRKTGQQEPAKKPGMQNNSSARVKVGA
jgi:multidrug efflux system membrane fusion protein